MTPHTGEVWKDAKGEIYARVDDPDYPWRFLDFTAGTAEPRDEDFPHRPLHRARFGDEAIAYRVDGRIWHPADVEAIFGTGDGG